MLAAHDLTVASVDGTLRISAKRELTLASGGAFISIKDGNITLGGPGDLFLKTITVQKQGAQRLSTAIPPLPETKGQFDETFIVCISGER